MSHFSVLVILDGNQAKDVEGAVAALLYSYDENLEVDKHSDACWCLGEIARSEARKAAEAELGTWESFREKFHAGPASDKEQTEWQAFTKPLRECQEALEKANPMYRKPTPDCENCKGTGAYETTSNPLAKWDWFQIGGRWTGDLTGYDPSADPRNMETCDLCSGTGTRPDMKCPNGCNGCDGKGTRVKWPTQWADYEGNVMPMGMLRKDFVPYAVVTPDAKWFERGEMGWWGLSSNEKPKEDWEVQARRIMQSYRGGHVGVIVDCHI